MKKLPVFLKQYFWDVDFKKLNLEKSKILILKIILERGDLKAINWLPKYYTKENIKELVMTAKDLSPKTANFWAHYLNINIKEVPVLQKPYTPKIPILLTSSYLNRRNRINEYV